MFVFSNREGVRKVVLKILDYNIYFLKLGFLYVGDGGGEIDF